MDVVSGGKVGGGVTEVFVYDARGRLAAEYGGTNTETGTHYLTADHLGSTRVITDASKAVIQCRDYLPFGGELLASAQNERNGIPCYSADTGLRQKFTGKERDEESRLDFFGARYHSWAQGRFTSPDPLLNSGQPWNPQSWNRYAYVDNNPLRYTDPLGLYKWSQSCDEENDSVCRANRERFRTALENVKKAAGDFEPGSKERKQLENVIKRIGEEGKGNVTIGFGDAGSTASGPNLGITGGIKGTDITLNFNAVDQVREQHQLNAAESSALDAGLVAHEGEHVGWGVPLFFFLGMSRESTAYRTESFTYQGLHNTDRPTRLWNESWLGVDRQLLEQRRENAIREVLNPRRQQQNPAEEQR